MDLFVEDRVIVEIKALENVLPVHKAQLLSYLRLANCRVGLLINFNVEVLRDGIYRIVNKL
jgi:GxxExxY protein